jgi:hypothetical protein
MKYTDVLDGNLPVCLVTAIFVCQHNWVPPHICRKGITFTIRRLRKSRFSRQGPISGFFDIQTWPPVGLNSANEYNPEQSEEFGTNSNCNKWTVFTTIYPAGAGKEGCLFRTVKEQERDSNYDGNCTTSFLIQDLRVYKAEYCPHTCRATNRIYAELAYVYRTKETFWIAP